MFITICRTPDDGKSQQHTQVFECDSYTVEPFGPDEFLITMDRHPKPSARASYLTSEAHLGIYVTNDNGRTVDTIFRSPDTA